MNRQFLYILDEGAPSTFSKDNDAPSLPLPSLDETMDRYYESLKPFGTKEELANSRRIIDDFRNGVGQKLHAVLIERAKNSKNWVEKWWEDYAYCTDRTPIYPYTTMAGPLMINQVGMPETTEFFLKGISRAINLTLEYWDLVRKERMRPYTNPSGTVTYSSFLLKRVFSTLREPGAVMDKVVCHFRTKSEGTTPSHVVIIGKGRIFTFNGVHADDTILTVQEIRAMVGQIVAEIDSAGVPEHPVPILTCDNRSSWAQNRAHLQEISANNRELLDIIEKATFIVSMDEHHPANETEVGQLNLTGDLYSRWADKSSCVIMFRNGKIGCSGEHSCYDGTISMAMMFFMMISYLEYPEPDWSDAPETVPVPKEIKFDLDDELCEEIQRVYTQVYAEKDNVMITCVPFTGFGKAFLKEHRLHPDAFIQMVIQLTYYKMHSQFVATYETALMRNYYNGRTETLRTCTMDVVAWVKAFLDPAEADARKLLLLKTAVNNHNERMEAARNGKGIDRHLFGMWCAAYEADLPIPDLYDDELYKKSGGGGNFVLSTSTLGYSICCGYVAPMCRDGYAFFYSITDNAIFVNSSAFRDSETTSAHKFNKIFEESMLEVRALVERVTAAKL